MVLHVLSSHLDQLAKCLQHSSCDSHTNGLALELCNQALRDRSCVRLHKLVTAANQCGEELYRLFLSRLLVVVLKLGQELHEHLAEGWHRAARI